ncbi:MAG: LysE family transporter [Chlamydiia bacterium]|nr:LysE family transporter [Chlamydiia bacterium]
MDLFVLLFSKGLIAGFCYSIVSVTAALYCAHFVIKRSWICGMAAGFGITLVQILWSAIALWALDLSIDSFQFSPIWVALIGAGILYLLAFRSYQMSKEPLNAPKDVPLQKLKAFAQAVPLALAYPLRILGFGAIFLLLGLHNLAPYSAFQGMGAVLGVGLGSFCWWTLVTLAVLGLRDRIPPRFIQMMRRLTAFGIAAFATGGLIVVLVKYL